MVKLPVLSLPEIVNGYRVAVFSPSVVVAAVVSGTDEVVVFGVVAIVVVVVVVVVVSFVWHFYRPREDYPLFRMMIFPFSSTFLLFVCFPSIVFCKCVF